MAEQPPPSVIEELAATGNKLEIWWDSSPLIFAPWVDDVVAQVCESDQKELRRQFKRPYNREAADKWREITSAKVEARRIRRRSARASEFTLLADCKRYLGIIRFIERLRGRVRMLEVASRARENQEKRRLLVISLLAAGVGSLSTLGMLIVLILNAAR